MLIKKNNSQNYTNFYSIREKKKKKNNNRTDGHLKDRLTWMGGLLINDVLIDGYSYFPCVILKNSTLV